MAIYMKKNQVTVKMPNGGERIITISSEGKETENTTSKGDYIITNKRGVYNQKRKIDNLYELKDESKGLYIKKAKIYALEFNKETFPNIYEQYRENLSRKHRYLHRSTME